MRNWWPPRASSSRSPTPQGSQSALKRLKPSTRRRFLSIAFDVAEPDAETRVIAAETGLRVAQVVPLVRLAGHIRKLSRMDMEESVGPYNASDGRQQETPAGS
ncbi:CbbQ/NirQ/NorQ C-terminal domain-containing protein [Thioclava nitratireducens]|uniref:CbbQ/NirQ/NorQ domain-containing protein n=1 Tax=Thioclava nitratireducens TaxID=1915078 RepID=UPI001FCBEABE|nr:CbbQ/NirQ/NorQ C-terminal domain-containing protein [Thioclava nitratireducens]